MGAEYIHRFRAMVDELRTVPELRVTHLVEFQPVSEEVIARVEQRIQAELAPFIKSFYRRTNGLQMRWVRTYEASRTSEKLPERQPFDATILDGHDAGGLIFVLPLEAVYLDQESLVGDIPIGDAFELTDNLMEYHPAVVDLYESFCPVSMFLTLGDGNPPVIMGDNYGVLYEGRLSLDFEAYMEFLIVSRGLMSAREWLFSLETNQTMGDFLTVEDIATLAPLDPKLTEDDQVVLFHESPKARRRYPITGKGRRQEAAIIDDWLDKLRNRQKGESSAPIDRVFYTSNQKLQTEMMKRFGDLLRIAIMQPDLRGYIASYTSRHLNGAQWALIMKLSLSADLEEVRTAQEFLPYLRVEALDVSAWKKRLLRPLAAFYWKKAHRPFIGRMVGKLWAGLAREFRD